MKNAGLRTAFRILVVAAATGAIGTGCSGGEATDNDAIEITPATAQVASGDFVVTVSATGKVEPEAEVEVKSKASGEIVEFPFEAGDPVNVGELVCRLDPSDEKRNVERSRSDLAAAEARLDAARADLRLARAERDQARREAAATLTEARARLQEAEARLARDEALLLQGVVSTEEIEASSTRVVEAKATVERAEVATARALSRDDAVERARHDVVRAEADLTSARITLEEAGERLAETRILAPLTGVVTETMVEAGQVISSAISNVGGGTTLLKIADLSRLYVQASVDEVDIGQVREGQKALVRADALPESVFGGKVVQISPVGIEEQNVVLFEVKVSLEEGELGLLRPGMTADVEVEVARSTGTLWIPRDAFDPEASTVRVVSEDGTVDERTVVPGLRDAYRVEIRKGLAAEETVRVATAAGPNPWRKESASTSRSRNTTRFLWRLRKK